MSAPTPATASPDSTRRWTPTTRVLFRLAFCYTMQYALFCNHRTLFSKVPFFSAQVQAGVAWLYLRPAQWLGQRLLHLTGAAATLHSSGFADRALDWVAAALMFALALIATLLWSLLDETRPPTRRPLTYPRLFQWMRWTLRLTLVLSLVWYASIKLFPIQIESPSLAVLNEPVGSTSPMTMLWTLLGMNPTYERICGLVELTAAALLLYRRTALAGALLALVILANIVLFDVFFDVPVRLYAGNLLLMSIVLIVPDTPSLLRFFWIHRPALATADWSLTASPRSLRIAALIFEAFVAVTSIRLFTYSHRQARIEQANDQHPSTLAGQWHIDSAIVARDHAPLALLGGSGQPQTDLFLEPSGHINLRSADRRLWGGGSYAPDGRELTLPDAMRNAVSYTIAMPDATHLILTPTSQASTSPELHLTRVPLPASYPLFERKPQLVEEWGFER